MTFALLRRVGLMVLAAALIAPRAGAQEAGANSGGAGDSGRARPAHDVVEFEGAPEPSLVPRSWELSFSPGPLRTIMVQDPGGQWRGYFYLPYRVTNHTGEERTFVPEFVMATDAGDVLDAGRGVPASVFDAIKAKLGNPLLESPNQVIGRILQGQDFAKESVAIWRAPDHDVDSLRVLVAGLSGEAVRVRHPIHEGESIVLRKTYLMQYETPGTPETVERATILEGPRRWVMR